MSTENDLKFWMKRLEQLRLKYPNLRLSQLILNAFSLHNGVDSRVYHMEDYRFVQELENYYRENNE